MRTHRPTPADVNDYYFTYIHKVPDGDVVEQLVDQIADTRAMLDAVTEEQGAYRYEADKWSVKEVLGHLADTERVFAYRALAFSRGDTKPIPGMDQDQWVAASGFDDLPMSEIVGQLASIRTASVSLFRSLTDEQWRRRGVASGFEFQAGAIAWIIAGHELHHRGVLVDRYGLAR